MRKQGQLKLFFQYILTAAQYIIKGKIDTKTIEYQMGGQFYLKKDPNKSVEERLQAYIDEAKRFFKTVISS